MSLGRRTLLRELPADATDALGPSWTATGRRVPAGLSQSQAWIRGRYGRRPSLGAVDRAPGLSVRLKLTISYASFLMITGILLMAAVLVYYSYFLPDGWLHTPTGDFWIHRDRLL